MKRLLSSLLPAVLSLCAGVAAAEPPAQTAAGPSAAVASGYWVLPVPGLPKLLPVGREQALGWDSLETKLFLLDGLGQRLGEPLLTASYNLQVYPAGESQAWVMVGSLRKLDRERPQYPTLYRVDVRTRDTHPVPLTRALGKVAGPYLVPWLRQTLADEARRGQLLKSLEAHPAFADMAGLRKRLQQLPWAPELEARVANRLRLLLERQPEELFFEPDISSSDPKLSLVLGPLIAYEALRLRLGEDGRSLWLMPQAEGAPLYHLDALSGALRELPGLDRTLEVTSLPGQARALVTTASGIYLVEQRGESLTVRRTAELPARLSRGRLPGQVLALAEQWWGVWDGQDWREPDVVLPPGSEMPGVIPGHGKELWLLWDDSERGVREELGWTELGSQKLERLPLPDSSKLYTVLHPTGPGQGWLEQDSLGLRRVTLTPEGLVLGPPLLKNRQLFGRVLTRHPEAVTWVSSAGEDDAGFILRPARDLQDVALSFGRVQLSLEAPSATPALDLDEVDQLDVRLKWPGQATATAHQGRLYVDVLQGEEVVASASSDLTQAVHSLALRWTRAPAPGQYALRLRLRDELGSDLEVRWPRVELRFSWLRSPVVRTVGLYGLLLLGAWLLLRSRSARPPLQRWVPAASWCAGGGLANLPAIEAFLHIDGALLARLVVATVVMGLPLGLVSPDVFRLLARAAPFDALVPLALGFPRLRRRLFAPYAQELERRLEDEAEGAHQEKYLPLPVWVSPLEARAPREQVEQPVARLVEHLLSEGPRAPLASPIVYVEAPGGQGKSALVRAVLGACLERFREEGRRLPVLCTVRREESLRQAVERALGRHLLSEAALSRQLEAGQLLVVVDGLSESELAPAGLQSFLESEAGQSTALLLCSRPSPAFRKVVGAAHRTLRVEPCRLDDERLERFESHYLAVDSAVEGLSPSRLSPELRTVCRGPDGSYPPILVRLAVRVGSSGVGSAAEVYERTFRALLRLRGSESGEEDLALLEQAAELCRESYWAQGYRVMPFADVQEERRKVMQRLLEAGLLVPADRVARAGLPPQQVKFFHDSMQSYLAARGLFLQHAADWKALSQVLFEAAGSPRFVEASPSGLRSELLQMCALVFRPAEKLREQLQGQLQGWAREVEKKLSKEDVERGLPEPVREALGQRVKETESAGVMLWRAVELCLEDRSPEVPASLLTLYQQIAPKAWQAQQAAEEEEPGLLAAPRQGGPRLIA